MKILTQRAKSPLLSRQDINGQTSATSISALHLFIAHLCCTPVNPQPWNFRWTLTGFAARIAEVMLRQLVHQLEIQTRGRGFYEFTDKAQSLVAETSFQTGLATLHLQHTSA